MLTASKVKELLKSHGIMVYRVIGNSVVLAELVRDNLIMEAHVSVETGESLRVRMVTRAQRSDFPLSSENEASLVARARNMGIPALELGFIEVQNQVEPIPDPMDPDQAIDVWYKVIFEKQVDSEQQILAAIREAIGMEKVAPR
jgi:hypothetical protein